MKAIYFAVLLLMPGLAFAQSSAIEFDKLLDSSGLCQGVTSQFLMTADQPGLDSTAIKELQSYAKQQVADHARVQNRLIRKYLKFLNSSEPGHDATFKSLQKRSTEFAVKAEEAEFSTDELREKTTSCSASLIGFYPYMFLYDDPNDKRIRDIRSPLNRVVTYFSGFVQCSVIMQKDYAADGGTKAVAVKRARSNLAQWHKNFPKYVKDKLPAVDDETILEYREILYNSLSLKTQIEWLKLDSESRQQQVQACTELDRNVKKLTKGN